MKKILLLLIIFTTGCIKYTDLGDLSIIKSIGISYHNSYSVYVMVYDDIKKDNEPKTKIIHANGKNLDEVFKKIKLLANKEIFLSHIDLLILDENLNDNNYNEIINYFIMNKNFRNDFLCISSHNTKNILENSNYNEIEDYINSNKEDKNIINITFDELADNYLFNKTFTISMIDYNKAINYLGNYHYNHSKLERINNE